MRRRVVVGRMAVPSVAKRIGVLKYSSLENQVSPITSEWICLYRRWLNCHPKSLSELCLSLTLLLVVRRAVVMLATDWVVCRRSSWLGVR